MQQDLETSHPELDIQLIGVNERGQEPGNRSITEGRDIPWLQDVDSDGDDLSDVWRNRWNVTYRDVVVLDEENVQVGTFNLTTYDLGISANYEALREMLVDTAMAAQEPEVEPGDANRDFRFDQLDLVQVLRGRKYGTGQAATWEEGDWNGDGIFDRFDVLASLQTDNYLQGPYAASEGSSQFADARIGEMAASRDAAVDASLEAVPF